MKANDPSHALGLILVDELVRHGLRHAVLSPGSRSAPLALALAERPDLDVRVRIDERSAAFTALGMARTSRRPVALVSTSGTAAANFLPAVIEASLDRVPLLVLTADRPPELRGTGANQTIDQIKLYGNAVRWFCEVGAPEDAPALPRYWRSAASRAWAEAMGSPAGPVHLNLPLREPLVPDEGGSFDASLAGREGGAPWTSFARGVAAAPEEEVARLADLIQGTERGLVVAGAADDRDAPAVLDFARRAGYPVIAEPTSGMRAGPPAISTAEALLRAGFGDSHTPEVVIRIGKTGLSRALAAFLERCPRHVLIDADGAWLDPERNLSHLIAAAPRAAFGAVPVDRGTTGWTEDWLTAEAAARRAVDDVLDQGMSEPRAARDLAAALPDGALLLAAASMPIRDLDWFMAPRRGLRVIANRGANGIDGVVSTAVGAAAVHDGPTVALLGDLALLHDANGLLMPPDETSRATLVVLNNDGGGIFSFLPQASHPRFEQLFGTPHGRRLEHLAALHGVEHTVVDEPDDLRRAVTRGGIVEVRSDRRENVEVHERCWEVVRRVLATGG